MRKPLIHSLLLALVLMNSACGNAKFNGKGKKNDKKRADVVVVEPPVNCKPGETCVIVDPNCKAGDANCPAPSPDDCKSDEPGRKRSQKHDDSDKDCPTQNDNSGQNDDSSQNDHSGQKDDSGQNDPVQHKQKHKHKHK